MIKLVDVNDSPLLRYIADMKNYNSLPEPFRETEIENFWWYFFTYSPEYIDFRQVLIEGLYRNVKIYFFFDKAFALVSMGVGKTPKVYEIGCQHEYKEIGKYMFEHTYHCPKCGFVHTVDSSG